MKAKFLTIISLGLIPTLFSMQATAEDGSFRARGGISINSFETIWSGGDMETDYTSLNLGVTYLTESRYYVDVAIKTDLGADWNTKELLGGPIDKDEDYSRTDITLTAGKVLENGIQLYVGYQNSDATIDLPQIAQDELGWNEDETVKITGFFAGFGKSFKVGDGSLNLNAALGIMDGKVIDSIGIKHDSSSGNGYSLGGSYTYFLTDSTSLSFEVKTQKYSYKYDASDILLTAGDDKMTMFGINLNKQF